MGQGKGVTYEDVEKAALEMLKAGIEPSHRKILKVTGGRSENVSAFLNRFERKREDELDAMANEIGSRAIAKSLASEVRNFVEKRNDDLLARNKKQQESIDELTELLAEKEADCLQRIELAENLAEQAALDAKEKVQAANCKVESALAQVAEYKAIAEEAKRKSDQDIASMQQKSDLLIENAKTEANGLVAAADKRADKAEDEVKALRDQVSKLTVEQAKREIEQEQLKQAIADLTKANSSLAEAKASISHLESDAKKNADAAMLLAKSQSELADSKAAYGKLEAKITHLESVVKNGAETANLLTKSQSELADSKTAYGKLETKVELIEKDNGRVLEELKEAKADSKKLSELQGQLVEMQKQLSQAKADLSQSERERESLTIALRKDKK